MHHIPSESLSATKSFRFLVKNIEIVAVLGAGGERGLAVWSWASPWSRVGVPEGEEGGLPDSLL